jgi:HTH-type transcriptional regulator/antitoxin HigA
VADVAGLYPRREPDHAVPPGESIREFLDDLGMTQRELAGRLDLSPKHLNRLIQGLVPLSPDVASRLELATGVPARMWNRLEADYQSAQQRLRQREDLGELKSWIGEIPVNELLKRGAIPAEPRDTVSRIQQVLGFFGVAHVASYRELYEKPAVAFRQAKAYTAVPGAVAAWLRLGELEARDIVCKPFDKLGLEASLPALRELTVERPEVFIPRMKEICAQYGVAVVLVPEIAGARVCGATKWLSPDKAMLMLSGRHKTDDQLWFTFFHEIGHVLKHPKTDVRIEDGQATEDPKEVEANKFALDILIPPDSIGRLATLKRLPQIKLFASELRIAPGIVVAQLHRRKILGYQVGQKLKVPVDIKKFTDVD